MTKENYSKYEAKEELVTLSFNHVLLHKKDTKIYQVIFLSLLILFRIFDLRQISVSDDSENAVRLVPGQLCTVA